MVCHELGASFEQLPHAKACEDQLEVVVWAVAKLNLERPKERHEVRQSKIDCVLDRVLLSSGRGQPSKSPLLSRSPCRDYEIVEKPISVFITPQC